MSLGEGTAGSRGEGTGTLLREVCPYKRKKSARKGAVTFNFKIAHLVRKNFLGKKKTKLYKNNFTATVRKTTEEKGP